MGERRRQTQKLVLGLSWSSCLNQKVRNASFISFLANHALSELSLKESDGMACLSRPVNKTAQQAVHVEFLGDELWMACKRARAQCHGSLSTIFESGCLLVHDRMYEPSIFTRAKYDNHSVLVRSKGPSPAVIIQKAIDVEGTCWPYLTKETRQQSGHVAFACLNTEEAYAMALTHGTACIQSVFSSTVLFRLLHLQECIYQDKKESARGCCLSRLLKFAGYKLMRVSCPFKTGHRLLHVSSSG
ncbi:hypothetical protein BKA58DRAFT_405911 [Alternaria rosae]|uniref:uncharacterized protein n=1 Tax=Alternaria rosae TaxID=1187941 RepID=UPI001E8D0789|nr:uncharacterized protein BKA58DRAFT_405911 [Alternaria rosae]KAH6859097.1 hypothetical protein BKA58DRAFT_405911 [Alternaria rosae]